MSTKIAIRTSSLLPLCLALVSGSAWAQLGGFEMDQTAPPPSSITEPEEWSEGRVRLPPWPNDNDLIELHPDGTDDAFRFFIDGANLSTDKDDDVVRYTIVIESPSGVRNVSFEGIRCTVRGHFKTYAYGAGGSFTRVPGAEWQDIPRLGTQAYVEDLFRNRLCVPREGRPREKKDILRALDDRGRPEYSTGFQAD